MLSFGVVFVFLFGVAPVQAQGIWNGGYRPSSWDGWRYYLQGDQVHMLQADQVNWVAETMNVGRRANMRYVANDFGWYNGYYGLNTPRGFYPMYQCGKGQRVGRYMVDIGVGTLLGAVLGGKKGAAIGGGLGAAVAVREDLKCWGVQNDNVHMVGLDESGDDDVMAVDPPQQAPSSRPRNGWDDRLRNQANAGGNSWFGSHRDCQKQGMFTLKNESGEAVRVFQSGKPFAVLRPRQSECGDPFSEYDAEMVVAVSDGFTARAQIVRAKPEGRQGGVWVWR